MISAPARVIVVCVSKCAIGAHQWLLAEAWRLARKHSYRLVTGASAIHEHRSGDPSSIMFGPVIASHGPYAADPGGA
jgi:hypothetical protein